jgi:CRISPR-associated protein Cas1
VLVYATDGPVSLSWQGRLLIKRTLEISREPAHLAVRNQQLVLKRDGQIVGSIPCEDIGLVMVDHPQTTYTHSALAQLAESDAAVVLCGADHLPVAIVLPLADHSQIVWRLRDQLGVSKPLQKQLWSQLVVAKVEAQARNLAEGSSPRKKLLALAKEVRSGDPMNIEAQAAKIYWANWLNDASPEELDGERFRRDPALAGLNSFLNYGYTVLRASIARAIVSAGLQPSLGIHHRNRSNAFCLADDLIEPFRPLVDDCVREMYARGFDELNQSAKAELLNLLTVPMQLGASTGPLMVMFGRYVASLVRCYTGDAKKLEIPAPVEAPLP